MISEGHSLKLCRGHAPFSKWMGTKATGHMAREGANPFLKSHGYWEQKRGQLLTSIHCVNSELVIPFSEPPCPLQYNEGLSH